MALGKKMEDDQRIRDDNRRDAESREELEKSQGKNNDKNDIYIGRPDLEQSLIDFKRLLEAFKNIEDENKQLKEDNDNLKKENNKNRTEIKEKLEVMEHLRDEIKRLREGNKELEEKIIKNDKEIKEKLELIEHLRDENRYLKEIKVLKEKDIKNNLDISDVPRKLRDLAFDHRVGGEINGWYWVVPYEGKLRDYTQNKIENMYIPVTRDGYINKKNVKVLVDKEVRIIYIEKNVYENYEDELSIADGDPIIVNKPKY